MKLLKFEVKKRFKRLRWFLLLHILVYSFIVGGLVGVPVLRDVFDFLNVASLEPRLLFIIFTTALPSAYLLIEPIVDYRNEIAKDSNSLFFSLPVSDSRLLNLKLGYAVIQMLVISGLMMVLSFFVSLVSSTAAETYSMVANESNLLSSVIGMDTIIYNMMTSVLNTAKLYLLGFFLVMLFYQYLNKYSLVKFLFPFAFIVVSIGIGMVISVGTTPLMNVGMSNSTSMGYIMSVSILLLLYALNIYFIDEKLDIA